MTHPIKKCWLKAQISVIPCLITQRIVCYIEQILIRPLQSLANLEGNT